MTKKTRRTRAEAKRLMWEYYRDNKARLPKWISEFREEILLKIMRNQEVEEVFGELINDLESAA